MTAYSSPPSLTDRSPGAGRVAPRAHFGSDAPRLDLSGQWAFRLASGLDDLTPAFGSERFFVDAKPGEAHRQAAE